MCRRHGRRSDKDRPQSKREKNGFGNPPTPADETPTCDHFHDPEYPQCGPEEKTPDLEERIARLKRTIAAYKATIYNNALAIGTAEASIELIMRSWPKKEEVEVPNALKERLVRGLRREIREAEENKRIAEERLEETERELEVAEAVRDARLRR